ncbi:unnamed protein product [Danaus chrysippus]|uniref:(African queen) hypothetical protein n=1 Tax=Danaus chrysippus TaxID=151541 RepID=A0A8J2QZG2_9NEOP|nr:unnamed protein product [Danaus chrysippus]
MKTKTWIVKQKPPLQTVPPKVPSVVGDPTTNWHLTRGGVPPYIGAPTRVRAKRQPLQEMESYSFTQALSQALQLRSWVKGDIGLTQLLDTMYNKRDDRCI